jgi:type IV pilus assembly protein PilB
MRESDKLAIVQRLQQLGLLSPEQLNALAEQSRVRRRHLYDLVADQNLVDAETLTQVAAQVLGLPYVDLRDREIPAEVLNFVPQETAENYQIAPFARDGAEVSVALLDPFNYQAVEALDFIARRDRVHMNFYLASETSIHAVLRQYANITKEVAKALEAQQEKPVEEQLEEEAQESAATSAPVSKMVNVILRYAVDGSASDVHIEPMEDGTRVRYRVDGVLHTSLQLPKNIHNSLVARIKVLANLKLDETRLPQDGRFRSVIDNRPVDFRVSTMPLVDQEKVVLRILDKESGVQTLEGLGYADRNLEVIRRVLKQPHGMVLITGPTGSGKSTTLYSMLQILNEEGTNIITLEDPVEYNMPGISQSQVRPEIGLTFSKGLRSVLRQDPDIIMVGEVRDSETAELAVHAALTGHLLLSTLHTNDAIGAIPRLVDMKIEPFLISSSLILLVAQRLVRKICEHCIGEHHLPPEAEQKALQQLAEVPAASLPRDLILQAPLRLFKGAGCARCDNTGYRGRVAISEVVEITDQLQEIIAQNRISEVELIAAELRNQGFVTMKQDGLIKAVRGQTTVEEVWTVTEE